MFVWRERYLRAHYRCVRCWSLPRWRAVIHALNLRYPGWRDLSIFESSPGGAGSEKLKGECARYVPSHFWPTVDRGTVFQGIRCEDLTQLTFPDESFDLVVTQDVFEHVLEPGRAFSEADVLAIHDRRLGLDGQFLDVFVSRRPAR